MWCNGPKIGDVIIRREPGNPGDHYSVREFPGVAQVSYGSLPVALEVAARLAGESARGVWCKEDGRYARVEFGVVGDRT